MTIRSRSPAKVVKYYERTKEAPDKVQAPPVIETFLLTARKIFLMGKYVSHEIANLDRALTEKLPATVKPSFLAVSATADDRTRPITKGPPS